MPAAGLRKKAQGTPDWEFFLQDRFGHPDKGLEIIRLFGQSLAILINPSSGAEHSLPYLCSKIASDKICIFPKGVDGKHINRRNRNT